MIETVIKSGHGCPIYAQPRPAGGLMLVQGSSHVVLSAAEMESLIDHWRSADTPDAVPPAKARLERHVT